MSTRKKLTVDVKKTKLEVVNRYIEKLGIEVAGTANLRSRCAALEAHFKANTPKKDIADCSTCKGESDVNLDSCPFCGDGEVDENDTSKTPLNTESVVNKVEPKPEGVEGKFTEKDLNKAVKEVATLKVKAAKSYWQLGLAVMHIHDKNLWKLRIAEGGDVAYRSFSQFCDLELGFSHTQAHKLMDVSRMFTEEQVEKFGVTKLGLALTVPEDVRAQVMGKIEEGASTKEIKDSVRDAKGEEEPAKPKDEKITVATLLGRTTIDLMKANNPGETAKKISDHAIGKELMTNGVLQTYQLSENTDGSLVLIVERKRG